MPQAAAETASSPKDREFTCNNVHRFHLWKVQLIYWARLQCSVTASAELIVSACTEKWVCYWKLFRYHWDRLKQRCKPQAPQSSKLCLTQANTELGLLHAQDLLGQCCAQPATFCSGSDPGWDAVKSSLFHQVSDKTIPKAPLLSLPPPTSWGQLFWLMSNSWYSTYCRFLYEYSRRHPEFSAQMLLRIGKGYEDLLKECCKTGAPDDCFSRGVGAVVLRTTCWWIQACDYVTGSG